MAETSEQLPVAGAGEVRGFVRQTTRRYRWPLTRVIVLHGLASAAGLAVPWLFGRIVDEVTTGTGGAPVSWLVAGIVAALFTQAVLTYLSVAASIILGERVLAELRERFVSAVLRLPLATVERAGTGDVVARTSRDVDQLSTAVRTAVPEVVIALVTAAATVVAIAVVSPPALVAVLLAVPLLTVGTMWYLRRAPAGYVAEFASYSNLVQGMTDSVVGARTVAALSRQQQQRGRVDGHIAQSYAAERYTLWLRCVWFSSLDVGIVIPVAAAILTGGLLYIHDLATLGQVTTAILYIQQFARPLDQIVSQTDTVMQGIAALRRLLGIQQVDTGAVGQEQPTQRGTERPDGTVELCQVGFRYPTRRADCPQSEAAPDVVRDVNLCIQSGERLAVVGPSGSGKSSLARLVAGIYPPQRGEVLLGGASIAEQPLAQQRRRVALVTQETHVFQASVTDNVVMASATPIPEDSRDQVLDTVGALEWVRSLPEGADTVVGSGGLELDSTQAQQLALARLLLADPAVVILDEATALFDPRRARNLERALARALAGRTVLAIAHRLHTAQDADRVAVLVDGELTELGAHSELLRHNGTYAQLWRAWSG